MVKGRRKGGNRERWKVRGEVRKKRKEGKEKRRQEGGEATKRK